MMRKRAWSQSLLPATASPARCHASPCLQDTGRRVVSVGYRACCHPQPGVTPLLAQDTGRRGSGLPKNRWQRSLCLMPRPLLLVITNMRGRAACIVPRLILLKNREAQRPDACQAYPGQKRAWSKLMYSWGGRSNGGRRKQPNVPFCNIYLYIYIEKNNEGWACVLLRSFAKAHCILCVLLRSLQKNVAFFTFFYVLNPLVPIDTFFIRF